MAISLKTLLAVAGGAALLASCAADPYYGDYAYNEGYYGAPQPYYDYNAPGYYDPGYYAGPTIGFGIGFSDFDRDDHHHFRGHDRGDWHGRGDWRGDRDHDGDRH